MNIKRKIQLSAITVLTNSLFALSMYSNSALANPCAAKAYCAGCPTLANCQAIADPGCTATSVGVCTNIGHPCPVGFGALCFYQ
jgi:hypothetical protein